MYNRWRLCDRLVVHILLLCYFLLIYLFFGYSVLSLSLFHLFFFLLLYWSTANKVEYKLRNCRPTVCQCQCCAWLDELGSHRCAAEMEEIEKSLTIYRLEKVQSTVHDDWNGIVWHMDSFCSNADAADDAVHAVCACSLLLLCCLSENLCISLIWLEKKSIDLID